MQLNRVNGKIKMEKINISGRNRDELVQAVASGMAALGIHAQEALCVAKKAIQQSMDSRVSIVADELKAFGAEIESANIKSSKYPTPKGIPWNPRKSMVRR